MAEVSVNAAAEAEYEAALRWYFERSPRAADGFEAAFDRAVASVECNPLLHPLIDDVHRFCRLRRYQYYLVYRVDGDRVRILAVPHARQRQGYWSGRV